MGLEFMSRYVRVEFHAGSWVEVDEAIGFLEEQARDKIIEKLKSVGIGVGAEHLVMGDIVPSPPIGGRILK